MRWLHFNFDNNLTSTITDMFDGGHLYKSHNHEMELMKFDVAKFDVASMIKISAMTKSLRPK